MKSSSIRPVTCRMDRIPTGETMTSTEIVALKGSKGGEGGGQGGIGGCVGGDGGDGGEGGEGGNCGGSSGCGGDGEGGSGGEGEGGRSSAYISSSSIHVIELETVMRSPSATTGVLNW